VANGLAKAGEKVFGGVIDLHDADLRKHLFRNWPVNEVWGIGRALTERLLPLGIRTTADLAAMDPHQARDVGTVVLERLVRELNGVGDDQLVVEPEKRQATAVTRMFGEPVTHVSPGIRHHAIVSGLGGCAGEETPDLAEEVPHGRGDGRH
jgi:DNA polymerase V